MIDLLALVESKISLLILPSSHFLYMYTEKMSALFLFHSCTLWGFSASQCLSRTLSAGEPLLQQLTTESLCTLPHMLFLTVIHTHTYTDITSHTYTHAHTHTHTQTQTHTLTILPPHFLSLTLIGCRQRRVISRDALFKYRTPSLRTRIARTADGFSFSCCVVHESTFCCFGWTHGDAVQRRLRSAQLLWRHVADFSFLSSWYRPW